MRAFELRARGIESLCATERPTPTPKPREVLLRLTATSMNYHDMPVLRGHFPWLELPRVPMSDGCGIVEAVGSEVTELAVGDRVFPMGYPDWRAGKPTRSSKLRVLGDTIDGCLQDYLAIEAGACCRAPAHLDDGEVATLCAAGVTAWNSVVGQGDVRAGEVVVVQGTGGVSTFALKIAKASGAVVIATSSSDEKLARAKELGADFVVNYAKTNWAEAVRELTNGNGADLVVDVAGSTTLGKSIEAAAMNGRIAVVGVLSGMMAGDVGIFPIFEKNLTIFGVNAGSVADGDALVRAMEASKLHPEIGARFRYDQCAEALALLEAQKHVGKIVLTNDRR